MINAVHRNPVTVPKTSLERIDYNYYTRVIWKVSSGELLTKEERRIKIYYIQKNMYIIKLLLNVVTAGIEALVVSGNKFLYARVKELCRL
jgi:hypothetical protein